MVKIKTNNLTDSNSVAAKIYKHYADSASDWRRPHLGASLIGHECSRYLWYTFRWAAKSSQKDGRILRLFKRGDVEEQWIAQDLAAIGVVMETTDTTNDLGKQWSFSWVGGHFSGSCDGLVREGWPDAEKSLHVFECKTFNEKTFNDLVKHGVRKSKPQHFAQMQTYMRGFQDQYDIPVKRFAYVAVCKNDDRIHVERGPYEQKEADAALYRAESVIGSPTPPAKVSNDPSYFACKWCDFYGLCQLERAEDLERNCRTCLSSTPLSDGTWWCEHWQSKIPVEHQKTGCAQHLFVPQLLPWEAVDADEVARTVSYKDRNGIPIIDADGKLVIGAVGKVTPF